MHLYTILDKKSFIKWYLDSRINYSFNSFVSLLKLKIEDIWITYRGINITYNAFKISVVLNNSLKSYTF